ncbi:unnamed protein product [Boreogadus saida]
MHTGGPRPQWPYEPRKFSFNVSCLTRPRPGGAHASPASPSRLEPPRLNRPPWSGGSPTLGLYVGLSQEGPAPCVHRLGVTRGVIRRCSTTPDQVKERPLGVPVVQGPGYSRRRHHHMEGRGYKVKGA